MMKVLILDGPSGSGKSTLRRAFYDKYKSDILVIDRFTPCNWVYDYIRGIDRREEIGKFEEEFDKNLNPYLVLLSAALDILEERCLDRGRSPVYEFKEELEAFDIYFKEVCRYSRVMEIDGSNSIEFILRTVDNFLGGR